MDLNLYFDGSCWPNPGGLARYGFTLRSTDEIVNYKSFGLVGDNKFMSNNHAELFALAEGLEYVLRVIGPEGGNLVLWGPTHNLFVGGDSEMSIKLMSGRYQPNRQRLYYPQYVRAKIAQDALEARGCLLKFVWVAREDNQECDTLSKMPVTPAALGT